MAAPTAIPHPEASAHHHGHQFRQESGGGASSSSSNATLAAPPTLGGSNGLSRSPTNTSPKQMVSPIYTQAGRSAFSLPGPNSASTSPTTTTWYSAGFASGNSQRVRSPTAPFAGTATTSNVGPVSSAVAPQRDSFPDAVHPSHLRSASFGSASNASSLSSADLSNEPTTPRTEGVPPFGGSTTPSNTIGSRSNSTAGLPLGTSYEQIKKRRDSWSFANAGPGNRWSGLASLRERTQAAGGVGSGNNATPFISESAPPANMMAQDGGNAGPMGGLLRKFSIGGGQPLKSPMNASNGSARMGTVNASSDGAGAAASLQAPPPTPASATDDYFKPQTQLSTGRGRQASVGSAGQPKRRPSPMGERLLMGHFNAH